MARRGVRARTNVWGRMMAGWSRTQPEDRARARFRTVAGAGRMPVHLVLDARRGARSGRDAPFFTSKLFGVKASPRVTRLKKVPKGGGRDQTGKPYMVRGKWYYPKEEPGYVKTGTASWYGANFHGR